MKKFTMDKTALVFFIFILGLGIYDLAVVTFSGTSSSISNFLVNLGLKSPIISFVLGCIAGHALFPMRLMKDMEKENETERIMRIYSAEGDVKHDGSFARDWLSKYGSEK